MDYVLVAIVVAQQERKAELTLSYACGGKGYIGQKYNMGGVYVDWLEGEACVAGIIKVGDLLVGGFVFLFGDGLDPWFH